MLWHDFIFSEKRQTKLLRHFVFWTMWWIYFYGTRFFYPNAFLPGHKAASKMRADNARNAFRHYGDYVSGIHVWSLIEFIRSLLMVSIHIAACYFFINYLAPRFLMRSRYLPFLGGTIMLIAAMIMASRFMDTAIIPSLPLQGSGENIAFYSSVFSGVINAIIIIAAASIIKYGKYGWQKQKEKEQLEREKIITELQLLKAQIRPGFLFNSLNNIYDFSVAASPRAPESLLKLSGLLSYMLYECDQPLVPLHKEIQMMKDYIAMEKIRLEETTEIEISVTGDLDNQMIAPFLLLPFIENSFNQNNHLTQDHWINLDLNVEGDLFFMKLANNMAIGMDDQLAANGLANVQKRLTLLYPQKHELKISHEPEMLIVLLKIQIGETTLLVNGHVPEQPSLYATQ